MQTLSAPSCRTSLIATISPRAAAYLAHPDFAIRLLGGAIWTAMAFGYAALVITTILTAPTAAAWLIQQGGQFVAGL